MKQQRWQYGTAVAVWLLGGGPDTALAQSVDTSMARAMVDQPLAMSVQVRAFDWPAGRLTPDCLQVRLQQGDTGEPVTPLQVRTVPVGDDGRVAVHLRSPQVVTDTVLLGRISLHCGADYHRDFTVLVDPPLPGMRPAPVPTTRHRSLPQPDTSRPTTAPKPLPASPRPWDDTQLQHLVTAIVAALPAPTPAPTPILVAAPTAEPTTTDHPWQDLRDEQRQTRTHLAALVARIERSEHDTRQTAWRDALLVLGTVLGLSMALLLVRLVREGLMPRLERRPAAATRRAPREAHHPSDDATAQPSDHALTPAATDNTHHPLASLPDLATPTTLDWSPPTPSEARWPDADFGHPNLDSTPASRELLAELEPHVADTPVGVAVVLERRLQAMPEKCPWILLRLLALYRDMEQPWNHERVAAQLGALYNVHIPDMAPAAAEGPGLELDAYPDTLDRIVETWSQESAEETLSGLLLRPTIIEVLDQPAFETALLLHDLLRQRQTAWLTAIEGGHTPTPPTRAPGQDRLLELLAA